MNVPIFATHLPKLVTMHRFRHWVTILTFGIASLDHAMAAPKAQRVVVLVWDGLRPDCVTPQHTPVLFDLASRGTFFKNHHSAYVSSTEVNGTALATGLHPDHSGILANRAYTPEASWLSSHATESLDVVRRMDALTKGNYLKGPTVAEILQRAGISTITAGAKPIALLHDRSGKKATKAQKDSVTLFRGQSIPRSVSENLTKQPDIGPLPTAFTTNPSAISNLATNEPQTASTSGTETNSATLGGPGFGRRSGSFGTGFTANSSPNTPDNWTTKALVRGLWRKEVPKYTLLWLSEPDASQHLTGPDSASSIAALESSDKNLSAVLKSLEEKGLLDTTDLFVVSDHGFSTISRGIDLIEALKKAKFSAASQFENPEAGDIMVVNLGGTVFFYVFDHDVSVVKKLVTYLQGTDFAGALFSSVEMEGAFPLNAIHLASSEASPDVVMSMRWSDEFAETGLRGQIISPEGKKGAGTHASLSRFDLHNTLIASGPDFRSGFLNEIPSGNIDVAPTVLTLLGVEPSVVGAMDGRVLAESFVDASTDSSGPVKPTSKLLESTRDLGFLRWSQYLKTSSFGKATYYDEANANLQIK